MSDPVATDRDPQYDHVAQLIDKAAVDLAEHVESVVIIATSASEKNPRMTHMWAKGRGNFYAQVGSIKEWMLRREEETKQNVWSQGEDIP